MKNFKVKICFVFAAVIATLIYFGASNFQSKENVFNGKKGDVMPISADSIEQQLFDLGKSARKRDQRVGNNIEETIKQDIPSALLYIDMMVDDEGKPVPQAQELFAYLEKLPKEKQSQLVQNFVKGYTSSQP